jgi:hypothetical protein
MSAQDSAEFRVYCHESFLERLDRFRNEPVGRRGHLLLQKLMLAPESVAYKSTRGHNEGWRRSTLGGNSGFQHYVWWTRAGARPAAVADWLPPRGVAVRELRDHDDHARLTMHDSSRDYCALSLSDLTDDDGLVPSPLTDAQRKFARSRGSIRVLSGFPGSGKTTALWRAVSLQPGERLLYITFSTRLAALAESFLTAIAPPEATVEVMPFSSLLLAVLGKEGRFRDPVEARRDLLANLAKLPPGILGPWAADRRSLYDEMHANLIGAASLESSVRGRLSDDAYLQLRQRALGRLSEAVIRCTRALEKSCPSLSETYFPELHKAAAASARWRSGASGWRPEFDWIVIDEVQDLTRIEASALLDIAGRSLEHRNLRFLVAGDEAQTVRPTDFEWGWFNDQVATRLGMPERYDLEWNLRNPGRIGAVVRRSWQLYGQLVKAERPRGACNDTINNDLPDELVHCVAPRGHDLTALFAALERTEGLVLIAASDRARTCLPHSLSMQTLSPADVKGLDFPAACVVNGSDLLDTILEATEDGSHVAPLACRSAIDALRVCLSRPGSRLYLLDIDPSPRGLAGMQALLGGLRIDSVDTTGFLDHLDSESLPPADRVTRFAQDALEAIERNPQLACMRAGQADALLPLLQDASVRADAHAVLVRIYLTAAVRGGVDEEMRSKAWARARMHAEAHSADIAGVVSFLTRMQSMTGNDRASALAGFFGGERVKLMKSMPWLRLLLTETMEGWLGEMEKLLKSSAHCDRLLAELPGYYKTLGIKDAKARLGRAAARAAEAYAAEGDYAKAILLARSSSERDAALLKSWTKELAAQKRQQRKSEKEALTIVAKEISRTLSLLRRSGAPIENGRDRQTVEEIRGKTPLQMVNYFDAQSLQSDPPIGTEELMRNLLRRLKKIAPRVLPRERSVIRRAAPRPSAFDSRADMMEDLKLARAFASLGDYESARRRARRIERVAPDLPGLSELLRELDSGQGELF